MSATTRRVWSFSAKERRQSERRAALTVAALFVVTGASWVLVTDAVLYRTVQDPVLIARLETAKGWAFVALGGLFLYAVTLRSAARLTRAHATTAAVVESIADGILLLGRDRTIKHANPSALRMLRCEGIGELAGMSADEFSRRFRLSHPDGALIPPDDFVSQRVFVEGGPLRRKSVLHPPGAPELVISATAAAVRDEVGEPPEVVVSVMHDITLSEHLERVRDEFFAAAAHALKTPVTIIQANAQLIARERDPRHAQSTAAIERQCERIDRLVRNLFVIARVRTRSLQLRVDDVDLGPLVDQVAREAGAGSPKHHVRIELARCPRVRADPERIALVVRNLLDDACHSSPAGSTVVVQLDGRGQEAEVLVRHRRRAAEEPACTASGEFDELGIARCASTTVAEAHGGSLGEAADGAERSLWLRLPTAPAAPAARAGG
jgi:signal transduction histidine kinase